MISFVSAEGTDKENRTNFDAYCIFGGVISEERSDKQGTYIYQEMCFMTGKPVLLTGTIEIPAVGKKSNKKEQTVQVKYKDLSNDDGTVIMNRTVSYILKSEVNPETGKEKVSWDIKKGGIKEEIVINDKKFSIKSFDFDKKDVVDTRPAVRYTSSDIYYKKIFRDEESTNSKGIKITVEGSSLADLSYENLWSEVHSVIMNQTIVYETLTGTKSFEDKGPYSDKEDENNSASKSSTSNWYADYKYKFAYKMQSSFSSHENTVRNISFRKVYKKNINFSNQITYAYDLPDFKEKKAAENGDNSAIVKKKESYVFDKGQKRKTGEISLQAYEYENSEVLNVPNYKDIGDHWAEEDIVKMASIGSFDLDVAFFPDVAIDRKQFARAVINTIDKVKAETNSERREEAIKSKRPGAKELRFSDVPRESEYYVYIDSVAEKGIMVGRGNRHFMPDKQLSREEAITVIIRALGIEDMAPAMYFDTGFVDDSEISEWAKPSVYMAKKIGLIHGYNGKVMPKRYLSRAEISVMLSNLVEHLRVEMVKDYKDALLSDF